MGELGVKTELRFIIEVDYIERRIRFVIRAIIIVSRKVEALKKN